MKPIERIHHISAIVGNPNENIHFYQNVLGLRLIKRTVNFEDPSTYHLYFADHALSEGFVMTFFNWSNDSIKGRTGSGQVGRIAFRIPAGSFSYWQDRLSEAEVETQTSKLFIKDTLEFEDPHGLALALVEGEEASNTKDLMNFHGAVLLSNKPAESHAFLVDRLGLELYKENIDDRHHYLTKGKEAHHLIVPQEILARGRFGLGTVHHIAWAVEDEENQLAWKQIIEKAGFRTSEIKDRHYFRALYSREPGGVIYEYATKGPGFFIDEEVEEAGNKLMLPPQYETERGDYEAALPEIKI